MSTLQPLLHTGIVQGLCELIPAAVGSECEVSRNLWRALLTLPLVAKFHVTAVNLTTTSLNAIPGVEAIAAVSGLGMAAPMKEDSCRRRFFFIRNLQHLKGKTFRFETALLPTKMI